MRYFAKCEEEECGEVLQAAHEITTDQKCPKCKEPVPFTAFVPEGE